MPEASEGPVTTRVRTRMTQMLAFVDSELAAGPYFAGATFTAADVMMTFPFTTMRLFLDYDLAPFANIVAYLKRIEAPAYRRRWVAARPAVLPEASMRIGRHARRCLPPDCAGSTVS